MKKLLLGLIILSSSAAFAGSAISKDGFAISSTMGEKDKFSLGFELSIPIKMINEKTVIIGSLATHTSETPSESYTLQIVDDEKELVGIPDGSADYVSVGLSGRRVLFGKRWLEGIFGTQYSYKIAGTTKWAKYSRDRDGKDYNPLGGLNLNIGTNFVVQEDGGRTAAAVGFLHSYNIAEEKGVTYIKLEIRF